ncbi:MAG TPA: choline kinase family protein [Solirubrobacteraceae bacterium]|jgi:thiamine kinase-like enzyme
MADELNDILEQLVSELGASSGQVRELDGGITNRNFRVTLGGHEYVVRRPGKDTELLGIDRSAELLANETAAALGIAPAVASVVDRCLVTSFVTCRALQQDELVEAIEEIAHALRAFHDSGAQLPTAFWVPQLLEDYAQIVQARGRELPLQYAAASDAARQIAAALPADRLRPCHNDLLSGNLIRAEQDGRTLLVDWEYAGMGDARFDLGNLSVNNGFDEQADERLLTAYYGTCPDDGRRAALKLMRVLSDAREAAWGVVQGTVSQLDFDFDGYAHEHFERLQAAVGQDDFGDWLAAASAARSASDYEERGANGQAA